MEISKDSFRELEEEVRTMAGVGIVERLRRFSRKFMQCIERYGIMICRQWVANVVGPEPLPENTGKGKLAFDLESLRSILRAAGIGAPSRAVYPEKAYKAGVIRSIGISNFRGEKLKKLLAEAEIKPHLIQLEAHPYCTEADVTAELAPYGTKLMSWYPLGHGDKALLQEKVFEKLGKKYGKSAVQIIAISRCSTSPSQTGRCRRSPRWIRTKNTTTRRPRRRRRTRICTPTWTGKSNRFSDTFSEKRTIKGRAPHAARASASLSCQIPADVSACGQTGARVRMCAFLQKGIRKFNNRILFSRAKILENCAAVDYTIYR